MGYSQEKDALFVLRWENTHIILWKTHGDKYLVCLSSLISLQLLIIISFLILIWKVT